MSDSLSTENELLLQCARSTLAESHSAKIAELVRQKPCWDSLLILAAHHKLLPLLYKHLLAVCPADIPPKTRKQLEKFCWANSINALEKTRTLIQVAKLFASNNIEMITVKGPLFTARYMGDISLRSYCDVDILVSREAFDKACRLLAANGFRYVPENISEDYFLLFSRSHNHGQLISSDGTIVEVHWELSGGCGAKKLDYDLLKPYIEIQELQGHKLATLRTEPLLVYLAIHAQRHCWQRYDHVLCIAEILQHSPSLDWQETLAIARNVQVEKILFLSIFLAGTMLGGQVSGAELIDETAAKKLAHLKQLHEQNWQNINTHLIEPQKLPSNNWIILYPWPLRAAENKFDLLVSYCKQYFIPSPSDWLYVNLPFQLRFLFYFVHPMRKLKNYLGRQDCQSH